MEGLIFGILRYVLLAMPIILPFFDRLIDDTHHISNQKSIQSSITGLSVHVNRTYGLR